MYYWPEYEDAPLLQAGSSLCWLAEQTRPWLSAERGSSSVARHGTQCPANTGPVRSTQCNGAFCEQQDRGTEPLSPQTPADILNSWTPGKPNTVIFKNTITATPPQSHAHYIQGLPAHTAQMQNAIQLSHHCPEAAPPLLAPPVMQALHSQREWDQALVPLPPPPPPSPPPREQKPPGNKH